MRFPVDNFKKDFNITAGNAFAYKVSQGYIGWWDASKIKKDETGWGRFWTDEDVKPYDWRLQ